MQNRDESRSSHYDILEVSQNASPEVIKAAYKSLMQRYHPDRNPGDVAAAERSIKVALAYEVLADLDTRATYDRELQQKSVASGSIELRARHILAEAGRRNEKTEQTDWSAMLLIAVVLIVGLVYFLYDGQKKTAELPRQVATEATGSNRPALAYETPVSARTLSSLFRDLKIDLVNQSLDRSSIPINSGYVLSIAAIDVVAGSFDSDKFISFMESNRDYIREKLVERLAGVDRLRLSGLEGERHLRKYILDALNEISGIDPGASPAITSTERYGAIDILLPDSYLVIPPPVEPFPEKH